MGMKKRETFTLSVPDFFLVLDERYAEFAALGMKTLTHFQPDSRVFLYDLSTEPVMALQELSKSFPKVEYTYWSHDKWLKNPWVDTLDFSYFSEGYGIKDHFKYFSRSLRHRLFSQMKEGWVVDKGEFVRNKKRVIHLWAQKAVCCQDCLEKTDRNIVFLDADAFVWQPLEPVFLKDFDVALTLRRLPDINIGIDRAVKCSEPVPYHAVNAGVIFLKNNDAARWFVTLWIEKMLSMKYFMVEQTALSQLVLDADKTAFTEYEKDIRIERDGLSVKVKLLPCERYNNFYISDEDFTFESDVQSDNVCVAHFKGHLHRKEYLASLTRVVEAHLSAGR